MRQIVICPSLALLLSCLGSDSLGARADTNSSPPRQSISLNGPWLFQRDGAAQWKTVEVPSSFQSHEGTNFHGIGWYRKTLGPFPESPGSRVLLQFQAAATEAEVWCDGQRLGSHLGGWTPFRFDLTEALRRSAPGQPHEIRVRLDERVGHNTQGFLPIIAPHFGGLWQGVSLELVPETYFDELELLAVGEPASSELLVQVPLAGAMRASLTNLSLRCRLRGQETWKELSPSVKRLDHALQIRAALDKPRLWSPAEPNLYEIELGLPGVGGDRLVTRAAFRSTATFGQEFRLNGQPLSIRGLLNWGFSAPLFTPNPGEGTWRAELEFARSHGFNLMKFCLWIPPKRYLELADEMGVLAWMEYPTWHPDFTAKFLEPLRREFREFFLYDRNHPAIVLRSLTCETGPSAELKVIQSLYDEAHDMIPGALVEDDSSWIGWNRVHDFYDDHPYGNNHTWVKTLAGFREYIVGHGLKPLVLGEAIAADTWLDRPALLAHLGTERPWWAPGPLDDSGRWLERMQDIAGHAGLDELRSDSLRYGRLMRKYQIEAYRREVPYGGYVISVIRDFPHASMGLLDYLGRSKWSEEEWNWQRDTICLLKTEDDRRSFSANEPLRGQILLSHFGTKPIEAGRLEVALEDLDHPGTTFQRKLENVQQNQGTLTELAELDWQMPAVTKPAHLVLRADLTTAEGAYHNSWPLWVVPSISPNALRDVQVHSSMAETLRRELFAGCPDFRPAQQRTSSQIVVAAHFDDALAHFLESGGRVLLLPDGQPNSFALNAHWFLRGAPYIPEHATSRQIPRDLLLELQHFDLAAGVIPNLPHLESLDPLLLLWDTHDQDVVSTHGIMFETRAGQGRLLVSAARHGGRENSAGKWLLEVLLEHLRSGPPPRHALPNDVWAYLKARLDADQTNLVSRPWKFKPDPKGQGVEQGWQSPALSSETDWKEIRIGTWWELQGYPELDGWAWYRLRVEIPWGWQGRKVYLSFEGVDDMYELFVNGEPAGKGGDLKTHQDALNVKQSHDITRFVKPGQTALLAVRVYDWNGYGGIFRPVTLGTLPFNPGLDLLR